VGSGKWEVGSFPADVIFDRIYLIYTIALFR